MKSQGNLAQCPPLLSNGRMEVQNSQNYFKGGIFKKKIEEGPKGNRGVIFIRRYGGGAGLPITN